MPRITLFELAVLFFAFTPELVRGQTVFNDGGTHTINAPFGPILVENNGTTLNVVSPASVTGSSGIQNGGAVVGGVGTTINLSGGEVTGAPGSANGGNGVQTTGFFSASGGTVTGGNAGMPGFSGGFALSSAGTDSGGLGVVISGGVFRGGDGFGGGQSGGAVGISDNNFSITGGTFEHGAGVGVGVASFALGDRPPGSHGVISGGSFLGNIGSQLFNRSVLDISGGSISGKMSSRMSNGSSLNFFGNNLTWTPTSSSSFEIMGDLTGQLSDGSSVDLPLTVISIDGVVKQTGNGSEISFLSIPEPSSVVMLALGIAGVALACVLKSIRQSLLFAHRTD
jgi:hypothetical protein